MHESLPENIFNSKEIDAMIKKQMNARINYVFFEQYSSARSVKI